MSLFALFLFVASTINASDSYRVEVRIEGFEENELYFAYHYGDNTYIKDTAYVNENNSFVFHGDEILPGGVYMVVVPPENNYFEILIDKNDQQFSLRTTLNDLAGDIEIYGEAPENRLFLSYLKFLNEKRKIADPLNKEKDLVSEEKAHVIEEKLEKISSEVAEQQLEIIENNPGSFTASLIKAQKDIQLPEFQGNESEIQNKQWRYYQAHYFDNIDLSDSRLLRTPLLFQKVEYFVDKLTVQEPDTISAAIDKVLELMKPSEETFKFYLIHFLNKYAKSKYIGMDAVYVHIGLNYYAKGLAPWTEDEQLEKIVSNAKALEPLLIGKVAPDFKLPGHHGAEVSLHGLDAEITLLYFWRENCKLCTDQIPELKDLYDKYYKKGLEIFTVCTSVGDDVKNCRDFLEENHITGWTNVGHPYRITEVLKLYDIKSSPQLYLLDKDKKILIKKIDVKQLSEIMYKFLY